jgi:hypothetical protein
MFTFGNSCGWFFKGVLLVAHLAKWRKTFVESKEAGTKITGLFRIANRVCIYGARQKATEVYASYWLCLPTPLITVVATYNDSAKAATVGHDPNSAATVFV